LRPQRGAPGAHRLGLLIGLDEAGERVHVEVGEQATAVDGLVAVAREDVDRDAAAPPPPHLADAEPAIDLEASGTLRSFARRRGGSAAAPGGEAHLALAHRRRVPGAPCASRRDDVSALAVAPPGVVVVDASGQARWFAALPAGTFPQRD